VRRVCIPTIGTKFTLAKDWTFTVHNEHRNKSLIEWMGKKVEDDYSYPLGRVKTPGGNWDYDATEAKTVSCTLPKGSILTVDRIYIRKGLDGFDSLSFLLNGAKTKAREKKRTWKRIGTRLPGSTTPNVVEEGEYTEKIPARGVRFWAKLHEVNEMVIK